jgi:hypothetical protein
LNESFAIEAKNLCSPLGEKSALAQRFLIKIFSVCVSNQLQLA